MSCRCFYNGFKNLYPFYLSKNAIVYVMIKRMFNGYFINTVKSTIFHKLPNLLILQCLIFVNLFKILLLLYKFPSKWHFLLVLTFLISYFFCFMSWETKDAPLFVYKVEDDYPLDGF